MDSKLELVLKWVLVLGMHTFNPITQEAEAGWSLKVNLVCIGSQLGLQGYHVSWKQNNRKQKQKWVFVSGLELTNPLSRPRPGAL